VPFQEGQTAAYVEPPVVQLCGVGMKIQDKYPHKVVSLVPTSPAAQSRIRVGHELTAINSQPVGSISADEIAALMRGFDGTPGTVPVLEGRGEVGGTRRSLDQALSVTQPLWKEEEGRGGEWFNGKFVRVAERSMLNCVVVSPCPATWQRLASVLY